MRRLLVDTHIVLWAMTGSRRLSPDTARLLADPRHELLWSAVVTAELATLARLGRIALEGSLEALTRTAIARWRFVPLAIEHEHALELAHLPLLHRDPFDRLLAAQARVEDVALVSVDEQFDGYGVRRLS